MHGTYDAGERSLYNLFYGEYRNKTRIKMGYRTFGNFVNGFNAGDYNAYISLRRQIQ
jgi:hypothetical protein